MSRFYVNLLNAGRIDDGAVIGYDKPLRTFFLMGFYDAESDDDEEPEIWLGTCLEEFPTLESLIEEARTRGYEVRKVQADQIVTMLAEAGHKPELSIAEKLGLIF